ncbi:MAG: PEF-CTERM sorting domain-containing protein [Methanosarcinales archaeon]
MILTATSEPIPEFTTIAIPVAAVLGLVFLMSRRSRQSKRRN